MPDFFMLDDKKFLYAYDKVHRTVSFDLHQLEKEPGVMFDGTITLILPSVSTLVDLLAGIDDGNQIKEVFQKLLKEHCSASYINKAGKGCAVYIGGQLNEAFVEALGTGAVGILGLLAVLSKLLGSIPGFFS